MTGYRGTPSSSQIIWLEQEVERLRRYEELVQFIANDYYELSHDKIKLLYDEYKKLCNKLIEVDRNHDK